MLRFPPSGGASANLPKHLKTPGKSPLLEAGNRSVAVARRGRAKNFTSVAKSRDKVLDRHPASAYIPIRRATVPLSGGRRGPPDGGLAKGRQPGVERPAVSLYTLRPCAADRFGWWGSFARPVFRSRCAAQVPEGRQPQGSDPRRFFVIVDQKEGMRGRRSRVSGNRCQDLCLSSIRECSQAFFSKESSCDEVPLSRARLRSIVGRST